ncbi:hypothetical protein DESPIG_02465 [Desulfovibrio piger ATCC 29098]|uniref:Uncharacterized protein n=1 Tax=Desulfovibrio piger ATCC 29098 TaxID=411464 RepID=B6WWJ7_9BACT|nr:hypothetical protein DESPIG_02465 [Desulfovibrio piger ATCC 29098]
MDVPGRRRPVSRQHNGHGAVSPEDAGPCPLPGAVTQDKRTLS